MHERAVELRQSFEVELLEGLGGAERGPTQAHLELLLLATGDLVLDEQGEELGVGELAVEGLTVAGIERVEDAGEAQLLQLRSELWDRVHRESPSG
jgi:hypothetical protein